jgi:hypothetical protein
MSDSWGKMYEKTFSGSMYGAGPTVFAVWSYAIAHMRPPCGMVELNPPLLAGILGCRPEDIEAALAVLCSPDPNTRSPAEDGKRLVQTGAFEYRAVNFSIYRAGRQPEERKAQNRESQARFRASNPANKPRSAQAEAEAEAEAEAILSSSKRVARKRAPAIEKPSDVDQQVWDDWLALRKSKRAPVTQTAINGARSEAAKAGMTFEGFLRVWCRRGSQGLEAAWLKPEERAAQTANTSGASIAAAQQWASEFERAKMEAKPPPASLLAMRSKRA